MKGRVLFAGLMILVSACAPKLGSSTADRLVKAMTPEEKVRTVVGTFTDVATPPPVAPGVHNRADYPGSGENTAVSQNQVPGAAGDGYAIPRLDIPAIVYADGPAGLRIDSHREGDKNTYYCTAFPTGALLSSAWDPAIVEEVGAAIGDEVRRYGVDILLAPGMNLQRNPLTGRNFEYYSEDPLVAGITASAYIKGVQSQGVGTSIKHLAANNQELYRNGIDEKISNRALRELYLRGFELAIKESAPWTVMSSYNKINGVYASENEWLLTDVLREEWGYEGFVMSDWFGADDPVAQMKAGNDLLMPGTPNQIDELLEAVKTGVLPLDVLDRNVKRILEVMARTPRGKGLPYANDPNLAAHADISRHMATEGMVLLQNNGTLPIAPGRKVALFGNYAYDTQPGGSGSGYVNRAYKVTLDQGLESGGYILVPELAAAYRSHIAREKAQLPAEYFWVVPTASEMPVSDEAIRSAAAQTPLAVVTLGRMSGEGGDRAAREGDYFLDKQEWQLLKRLRNSFEQVVVVLNIGAPVELTGVDKFCDAMLLAWLPGQEAGHAITDILSGAVNPSGKLPVSLAVKYTDIPSSRNFGVSEGEINVVRYQEDLMVGYRYFTTAGVPTLYPFGFGLSYTSFEYTDFHAEGPDLLSVTVRNSGAVAGREVVQIYVEKPALTPDRPARELCAFAKTPLLQPGESRTVEIPLTRPSIDPLAQWTDDGWAVAPGTYRFHAASSAEDMKLNLTLER